MADGFGTREWCASFGAVADGTKASEKRVCLRCCDTLWS
jgi:hypothetical protein